MASLYTYLNGNIKNYFEPILEIENGGSYVWRLKKKIDDQVIKEKFGSTPVLYNIQASWFTDKKINLRLLNSKIDELIYPINKINLTLAKSVYLKYIGLDEDAKVIYKNTMHCIQIQILMQCIAI